MNNAFSVNIQNSSIFGLHFNINDLVILFRSGTYTFYSDWKLTFVSHKNQIVKWFKVWFELFCFNFGAKYWNQVTITITIKCNFTSWIKTLNVLFYNVIGWVWVSVNVLDNTVVLRSNNYS